MTMTTADGVASGNTPRLVEATVASPTESEHDGATLHTLRLTGCAWPAWTPGQFVMIRPKETWAPLLWGRPFSICDVDGDELILFFQETGRGTKRLGTLQHGESVRVWGPLGHGFAAPAARTLLLAGGMGIAPFAGYVRRYAPQASLSFVFGHRLPLGAYPFAAIAESIPAAAYRETCAADLAAFIACLEQRIDEAKDGLILACGPMPFLRTVHRCCRRTGARAQLSLESRMACGVGACLGCVVKSATPREPVPAPGWPIQICTRGPVFWAEDIDLD